MDKYKKEVLKIHKKSKNDNIKICVYCGASAACEDHILPLAHFHPERSVAKMMYNASGWKTVQACKCCNKLASYSIDRSFTERKSIILERFEKKYRKNLKAKKWDKDDLKELDYNLRKYITDSEKFDAFLKIRHENLQNPLPHYE